MRKRFASLFLVGIAVSLVGVFLESFLRLAYEHNALGQFPMDLATSLLLTLGWPGLFVDWLGFSGATDFTHSHIKGSAFWLSVVSYVAINSLGWWASLCLLGVGAGLIRKKLPFPSDKIGSHLE